MEAKYIVIIILFIIFVLLFFLLGFIWLVYEFKEVVEKYGKDLKFICEDCNKENIKRKKYLYNKEFILAKKEVKMKGLAYPLYCKHCNKETMQVPINMDNLKPIIIKEYKKYIIIFICFGLFYMFIIESILKLIDIMF